MSLQQVNQYRMKCHRSTDEQWISPCMVHSGALWSENYLVLHWFYLSPIGEYL